MLFRGQDTKRASRWLRNLLPGGEQIPYPNSAFASHGYSGQDRELLAKSKWRKPPSALRSARGPAMLDSDFDRAAIVRTRSSSVPIFQFEGLRNRGSERNGRSKLECGSR